MDSAMPAPCSSREPGEAPATSRSDQVKPEVMSASVLDIARQTLNAEKEGLVALSAALSGELGEAFVRAVSMIRVAQVKGGRVILTGIGKSGHVGRKMAATLASTGTPAFFVHAAEARHGDLGMIRASDVVLALSWSGEATELLDVIDYTRRFKIGLIAITSQAKSALGTSADVVIPLPRVTEACPHGLTPTTSTTMQMAIGDALAISLLSARGFSASEFREFHPGGKLGALLRRARDVMHTGEAVPIVSERDRLSRAIVEMTSKRFGITAVCDEAGMIVGVITDGDLRRAFEKGFSDHRVQNVMSEAVPLIAPDTLAHQALAQMREARVTCFLVAEHGRPVGVLHIQDLLRMGAR